tara:strand:- start:2423 stop:3082 length:660 start_codon:yes stop_codon:yes gene_type:complete
MPAFVTNQGPGAEEDWARARAITFEQYPELKGKKSRDEKDRFYALAVTIFKAIRKGRKRRAEEHVELDAKLPPLAEDATQVLPGANTLTEVLALYKQGTGVWTPWAVRAVNKEMDKSLSRLVKRSNLLPETVLRYPVRHKGVSGTPYAAKGEDGKWYGWSHRAIVGFGIGDKLFDERWKPADMTDKDLDKLPFVKRGPKTIETDGEAKQAATNFARYVA